MPHFTLQIAADGPVLKAYVAVTLPRRQALVEAKQTVPAPVEILALIDTGATCTCVDISILENDLALAPTDYIQVHTPSTDGTMVSKPRFDAALIIPPGTDGSQPLMFPAMPLTGVDFKGQTIQALIGRDILNQCLFHYNGDMGFFTLAY